MTLRGSAAIFLLAGAWLGCASGPAPRDHFYRLTLDAPESRAAPILSGTLEVEHLRVEAVAQGRRILYRETGPVEEIAQHAYHQWANPPSVMLQDAMVEYFRAANVAETVVTPAVRIESDHLVSGRIVRLERLLGAERAEVVIELELILARSKGHRLRWIETYRAQQAASGKSVGDSVAAFEAAMEAILARFVADIEALGSASNGS
ncbi:MAG: ABC-type transport auxiliary lipoprotein family protein [Myxococcota bacterium]